MELSSFDEANFVFDKPKNMTYDECSPASCFVGRDVSGQDLVITCWKLTKEEVDEIINTGRIWCYHYGTNLQPHALSGKNPFL